MAKQVFSDGNPAMGVPGTVVPGSWLNKVFAQTFDGQNADGHNAAFKKGPDIASADALVFDTANGNFFTVTGTTTITSLPNLGGGTHVVLKFNGVLTLTSSASLISPAGNITTSPGDVLMLVESSAGVWQLISTVGSGAAFRAYRTVTQTITTAAHTKVQFNVESYDVASAFDSANSKFVAPVAGKYFFAAALHFDSGSWSAGDTIMLGIYKNGAMHSRVRLNPFSGASILPTAAISDVLDLAAADYVEMYIYQNSGVSRDVSNTAGELWFSGYRMGA